MNRYDDEEDDRYVVRSHFNPFIHELAPRNDGDRWKYKISWKSPTLILTFVLTLVYFLEVIIMIATHVNPRNSSCILYWMGAKYTPSIRFQYQFYRLFLAIFLHASPLHLISNLISQVMFGYRAESQLSQCQYIYVYFMAGVCGNLLSALIYQYGISVGASGAIFGLFGIEGAYLYINQRKQKKNIPPNISFQAQIKIEYQFIYYFYSLEYFKFQNLEAILMEQDIQVVLLLDIHLVQHTIKEGVKNIQHYQTFYCFFFKLE